MSLVFDRNIEEKTYNITSFHLSIMSLAANEIKNIAVIWRKTHGMTAFHLSITSYEHKG